MGRYRNIRFGVDTLASGDIPRHLHRDAYATVVLSGHFVEAAFAGRTRAGPGTVLLHGLFDSHSNRAGGGRGPTIVRLPWRGAGREGAHAVRDPDLLARLAERDPWEAEDAMMEMLAAPKAAETPWVDQLAHGLRRGEEIALGAWAEALALSPTSVSRGFRAAYGVSPQRFRLESRARRAWRRVVTEATPLTQLAYDCGFADLAHMSRSVAALTGASPQAWRTAR